MLAAVLVGNGLAEAHLARHSPNWSHRLVEAKFGMVEQATAPVDWVVLGDSSAAHGFRPDVWTAHTEESAWNLATVAGLGVVGDAWQLEDYLDRVGAPKGVLVIHTADVWSRSVSPALVGQVPRPLWQLGQWTPMPKWHGADVQTFLLSRFLPLYAESGSLVSSLLGRSLPEALQVKVDATGWARSRPADPHARAADAEDYRAGLAADGVVVSDENILALTAIDGICAREHLRLEVIHAPVWASIARTPLYRERLDAIDAVVRDAMPRLARSPIRFEEGASAEDLEATVDHLLPDAAARFTAELALRVGATPSAGGADLGDATLP